MAGADREDMCECVSVASSQCPSSTSEKACLNTAEGHTRHLSRRSRCLKRVYACINAAPVAQKVSKLKGRGKGQWSGNETKEYHTVAAQLGLALMIVVIQIQKERLKLG